MTSVQTKLCHCRILKSSKHSHLCREAAEEAVPEVHKCEGEVLVEEVAQELAHAQVRPSTVDQQESLEVTELSKGEIAGENRLHAFLTTYTNTDMCS